MQLDETEVVEVGGRFLRFGELANFMDASVLEQAITWAGYGATAQAVVDTYVTIMQRRSVGAVTASA